ncbi:chaperone protein ClpB1-like [Triticum urartu]|uniref:chaperone protein ClpB1-like n=1 Tax=Triticum urartu TaxID=4572 RepID=UPI002042FFAE|nr:chaperone protein ClpB1-like [Triticum urartu]
MIAGTSLRGQFEQRLKETIKQAEDEGGKLILFVDEMHMLIGAGDRRGTADAANILKPALARGRLRCVGATTSQEYYRYIEQDAALERRFQKVEVGEPSMQTTLAILQGLKQKYQEHHGLKIDDEALVAAVELAARYITGRKFPDKAIDLMDEACTTVKLRVSKQREMNAPREIVSRWTGVPITTLDQEEEKLTHLIDRLHERVVGQNETVSLVAQAVLRSRVGIDKSGQPICSFLFLGSMGVGKTTLAKALAEKLFNNEKMLVRLDMSGYAESGSLSRLIGGPRSYEEEGQLTEIVRRRPYSVILFDDMDKANPSILKLFVQLLNDGMLVDGKGRDVDFKNTIIIMSSNLGSEHLSAEVGGENTMENARDLLMKEVEKHFKPDLRNRLSEIVIFEPLSHNELREILKIQMKSVVDMMAKKCISLSMADAALGVILSESHDTVNGARPIKMWVKKHVTIVLSNMLVNGEACKGSTISIDASDDKRGLKYRVLKKQEMADPLGLLQVML